VRATRKEEEGLGCRQGGLSDPRAPRERIFGMALVRMRFGPGVEIFHPVKICLTVDLFAQVRIFRFVAGWMLFLPRRLSRCAVRLVRTGRRPSRRPC
jgi:hypothetical protein